MLSREQADALANLVHLLRPEWDRAGIFAALGRCKDRNELDVAMAAIRAAASSEIRSPGAIPANGDHWHERVSPAIAPRPLKPHEACTSCGRALHRPDDVCAGRPTKTEAEASHAAAVRHLVDVTRRNLCSHGVAPNLCVDHRKTTKTEPEESA